MARLGSWDVKLGFLGWHAWVPGMASLGSWDGTLGFLGCRGYPTTQEAKVIRSAPSDPWRLYGLGLFRDRSSQKYEVSHTEHHQTSGRERDVAIRQRGLGPIEFSDEALHVTL